MAKRGEYGMVYALRNKETGLLKIGHTKNCEYDRCRQVSNGDNWDGEFWLEIGYYFKDCRGAEKIIHEELESYSQGHELFKVELWKVIDAFTRNGGISQREHFNEHLRIVREMMEARPLSLVKSQCRLLEMQHREKQV